MKIGVLGAGGWGSALANLLAGNGHEVIVWSIDEREVARCVKGCYWSEDDSVRSAFSVCQKHSKEHR